ncbi:hypothetical protein YC2023_033713 [Brassica napus]
MAIKSTTKSQITTGKSPVTIERYLLEKEITLTVWCQDEEKHRNSRICNMLFIETSHCLADFIFSLGNHSLQLSDRERIDVKLNFTSDLSGGVNI